MTRRIAMYFAWDRVAETGAPLGDLDNRFPALAELAPELRAAIEATVLDGLTCAEAAVLLGVPEGTVKSRCHRARVALRTTLAEQPGTNRREVWGTP